MTDFPNFFTQHVFNRYLALSLFKFRKNVLFEDFCGLKAKNECAMAKPNTTHTQRFALRAIYNFSNQKLVVRKHEIVNIARIDVMTALK